MRFDAASMPFGLSLAWLELVEGSKPWFESSIEFFDKFDAALSPWRATYCSFASPKESRQRKGDPGVCVSPLRFGQPAVLASGGVSCKLGYRLKQARALIRLKLRSSAHSQGFFTREAESDSGSAAGRELATIFIAHHAGITWARGQNHLKKRRAAWLLGSDRDFAAQHPQGTPKVWRIWALISRMPAPSCVPATRFIPC